MERHGARRRPKSSHPPKQTREEPPFLTPRFRSHYVRGLMYLNSCHDQVNKTILRNYPNNPGVFLLPKFINYEPLFVTAMENQRQSPHRGPLHLQDEGSEPWEVPTSRPRKSTHRGSSNLQDDASAPWDAPVSRQRKSAHKVYSNSQDDASAPWDAPVTRPRKSIHKGRSNLQDDTSDPWDEPVERTRKSVHKRHSCSQDDAAAPWNVPEIPQWDFSPDRSAAELKKRSRCKKMPSEDKSPERKDVKTSRNKHSKYEQSPERTEARRHSKVKEVPPLLLSPERSKDREIADDRNARRPRKPRVQEVELVEISPKPTVAKCKRSPRIQEVQCQPAPRPGTLKKGVHWQQLSDPAEEGDSDHSSHSSYCTEAVVEVEEPRGNIQSGSDISIVSNHSNSSSIESDSL